jgi:hypothetical protein
MDYENTQMALMDGTDRSIENESTMENISPVQVFSNGNGCRVGVLAYCTDLTGVIGAQNLVNALIADGRFGSVTLVDGDAVLPTAQYLLNNFDAVIAVTDNKCGIPMPQNIADSAGNALAGFAQGGGGIVLSSFGYSGMIGFGNAIFTPGLSPFQKGGANTFNGGQVDLSSVGPDPICQCIFNGVIGPINVISSYSNEAALSPGATLCASYINGLNFAAVNLAGNIIGLNTFPFEEAQLAQESYRRLVANAILCVCGEKPTRGVEFTKLG